jgi:hypothetical protein
MAFEENALLFGHDPEPGIVAAHFDDVSSVALWLRHADGSTTTRADQFRPFLWSIGAPPPDAVLAIIGPGSDDWPKLKTYKLNSEQTVGFNVRAGYNTGIDVGFRDGKVVNAVFYD